MQIEDGGFINTVISSHDHVHQCTILVHGEDFKGEGEKIVVDKMDHDSSFVMVVNEMGKIQLLGAFLNIGAISLG